MTFRFHFHLHLPERLYTFIDRVTTSHEALNEARTSEARTAAQCHAVQVNNGVEKTRMLFELVSKLVTDYAPFLTKTPSEEPTPN